MLGICCDLIGSKYVLEPLKKHPRDYFEAGRLKVQLLDDAGRPANPKVGTSKRKLFWMIAEQIPVAQKKYEEALAQQKAVVNARKEQMAKLQQAQTGAKENPDEAASAGKKKDKKKKK